MTQCIPVGPIVRLQVQRSPLKHGPLGKQWYDPASITSVAELILGPGGVLGGSPEGGYTLDVHHRDHPTGKNKGYHDVSVLFTSHYRMMRACFGERAAHGVAGETILIGAPRRLELEDIIGGLIVQTSDDREAELEVVKTAEPCVEFTRYLMQRPPEARADAEFLAGLDFLRHGMRGFYCRYSGEPLIVRVGDRVFVGRRAEVLHRT